MTWGAVAGTAISIGGGLLNDRSARKAAKRAAAETKPWDLNSAGGYSVDYDPSNRSLNVGMTGQQQGIYDQLGGMTTGMLSGMYGPYQGYQQFTQDIGNNALPGMFGDYLGASANIPNQSFDQFGTRIGALGNMSMAGGMNALSQSFGPGQNTALSNNLFSRGLGMQNINVDNYRDIANNQLGLMRDLAAPQEERAANSMLQRMFSMGQMGGTAGARNIEAFAQGQSNADMERQLAAQQFAEGLYRGDQQFGLNQAQLGQGLLGMGYQGQTNDLSRQLGMGYLGQGMLGQSGGFAQQGLEGAINQSEMGNQRALQRLAQAQQQLFGGASMYDNNIARGLGMLQARGNMDTQLMNWLQTSSNVGTGQGVAAQALANGLPNTNPFSGFLEGLGGGLLETSGLPGFGGGGG